MAEQGIVEIVRLYLGRGLRGEPFGVEDEKLEVSVDLLDLGEELDVAVDYPGHLLTGVIAARPAAGLVPAGSLYSASDEHIVYQSDGAAWTVWAAAPAGGGGGTSPADTAGWMPLTTVVGGVPDLVWDATDSLIPTYGPF